MMLFHNILRNEKVIIWAKRCKYVILFLYIYFCQVVPHVTNEIQDWVFRVANAKMECGKRADVCVIELGGTVGDIESMHFIEALRQFQFKVGRENFCSIHVSLIPVIGAVGEQKTKPTQQTVRELRALGISPDFIACRSETPLTDSTRSKVSLFCQVPPENVLSVENVSSIYHVPVLLAKQNVHTLVCDRLKLSNKIPNPQGYQLATWKLFADNYEKVLLKTPDSEAVHVAIVGKYTDLHDAYISVDKALRHAAVHVGKKVIMDWIESTDLELPAESEAFKNAWAFITGAHAILIPGGFGSRGIEGKIKAAQYARVNKIPYLGLCLGFQIAVIEFARNVLGWSNATSEEFDKDAETKVIVYMPEISKTHLGGTMRLGRRPTIFNNKTCQTFTLYGEKEVVEERHRHRYEVNPELVAKLEAAGCMFVGKDESGERMEIFEYANHPYMVGTQFHPEFLSRPSKPSPPFVGLMQAAAKQKLQQQ